MPLTLYFAIPSAIIVIPSVPIYLIMLISQSRFRQKKPFCSPFFKISFHLGIFDLTHLFNDWLIGMLPYLGMYELIMRYQGVFAKQFCLLWWWSALAQKLGVFLLTIERLACMWFSYKMNATQTRWLIGLNWFIPVLLSTPLAFFNFGYYGFNTTLGQGVVLYWETPHYQWVYFCCCAAYCVTTSVVCGISYGLIFHKVYTHIHTSVVATRLARREARTEAKLAMAGFVLFFTTFACGMFCWTLVTIEMDSHTLHLMTGFQQLLFDVYCCMNPYLILSCSKAAKRHFKAVLCRRPPHPETVETKVLLKHTQTVSRTRIKQSSYRRARQPERITELRFYHSYEVDLQ